MFNKASWLSRLFKSRPESRAKGQASFRPKVETLEDRTTPATFIVKSTADAGIGTLRQAILDANSHLDLDTIIFRFNSNPTQPRTIFPLSALPTITGPVIIDGNIPDHGGPVAHVIEINGRGTTSSSGLKLSSNGSTIQGLVINDFTLGVGITITGDNNIIQNNRIGTSINGNSARGNQIGILLAGSQADQANSNLIGGPLAGQGNLISGNKESGIVVRNAFTRSTTIQGNFIGTNAAGTGAIANVHGVFLDNSPNTTVLGNVISANSFAGVTVLGFNAVGNEIKGNKIGTAPDGVTGLGNLRFGVGVFHGAFRNTIGGLNAGDGNIIAFNSQVGVLIGSDPATGGLFSTPAQDGNLVLSNTFFSQTFFIDLGPNDRVTPNDNLDSDQGPNNLQNSVFLTGASHSAGATFVSGSLHSSPDSSFIIQLYVTTQLDAIGRPTNLALLTTATANSDAVGNLNFNLAVAQQPAGNIILATATGPTPNFGTRDTSEFFNQVVVPNNPPMIRNDTLTPSIDEGGQATLSGQLVDPDPGDTLRLVVNWGDGAPVQTYRPGLDPFAFTHRYGDDGTYDVNFTWLDNHGGSNTRTRQVVVHNVAPELRQLHLSTFDPQLFQQVVLNGQFVDPGQDDFTVTVNWGDGTTETFDLGAKTHLNLKHRYSNAGQFTIHLTVADDDSGMTDRTLTIEVG